MAAKWSNEYVVAEHKDLQASTMALDNSGQYVLLAGRRCLAIIDVDNPSVVVKKFPRQSKWEVGSAEWNPHTHYSHLCAISSNQRTEILSWNAIDLTPINCLRFHTRAVSDLNWHHFEPALLASCSVDTYINIWDVRDPRKPCVSLSAVVGATQVRWNRVTGNLLATAHEGDVRLWDWRKGSSPVQYIAAHLQKIHGLDWSANQDYQLATSSQDCTVKFFDVNNPRVAENALRTVSPVWRARFTPFGEGMMTTQLRRGENSLLLWSLSDLSNPVHSFLGHNDVVLEFDWKRSRPEDDDYQLITWSKDQSLRIWRVDINLQKLCGYEPDNQPQITYGENDSSFNISTLDAISSKNDKEIEMGLEVVEETYMDLHHSLAPAIIIPDPLRLPVQKSVAASIAAAQAVLTNTLSPTSHRKKKSVMTISSGNVTDTVAQSENIHHYSFSKEIDQIKSLGLIGTDDSINVSDVDETQRSLTAVIRTLKHHVVLHITMPPSYPDVIPNFQFGKGTTVDTNGKCKLTKILKQTANVSSRKGNPSLELMLQQLLSTVDQLTPVEKSETESSSKPLTLTVSSSTTGNTSFRLPQNGLAHPGFLQTSGIFGNLAHHQDHNIPYPRSSGARFCSAGMLICFGRPSYLRRVNSKASDSSTTPRSLSVNQAYSSSLVPHSMTVSSNTTPYGLLYPPVAQSPTGDPSVSISSFYNQDRRQKSRTSKSKNRLSSFSSSSTEEAKRGNHEARQHKVVGMVTIYDASGLMPLQLELAERYVFSDTDVVWMCNQNAAVASQFGRKDLAYIWSLGALLATPALIHENNNQDFENPWAQNPFGRKLLHAIIEHYVKLRDIQTVAMLCCAFGYKCDSQDIFRRKTTRSESGSPGESPYHTIHEMTGDTLDSWNVISGLKQIRSNSWSDSLDDFRLGTPGMNSAPSSRPLPVTSIFPPHPTMNSVAPSNGLDGGEECKDKDYRLLDPKSNGILDNYRRCYADILYRWGLLEARVLVLKYLSTPFEPHRGVDFVTECVPCRQTVRGPQCTLCKRLLLNCIICRVVVKGSASFCLVCGHGGHSLHMAHWFAEEDVCPTGCGCNCLIENTTVFSV